MNNNLILQYIILPLTFTVWVQASLPSKTERAKKELLFVQQNLVDFLARANPLELEKEKHHIEKLKNMVDLIKLKYEFTIFLDEARKAVESLSLKNNTPYIAKIVNLLEKTRKNALLQEEILKKPLPMNKKNISLYRHMLDKDTHTYHKLRSILSDRKIAMPEKQELKQALPPKQQKPTRAEIHKAFRIEQQKADETLLSKPLITGEILPPVPLIDIKTIKENNDKELKIQQEIALLNAEVRREKLSQSSLMQALQKKRGLIDQEHILKTIEPATPSTQEQEKKEYEHIVIDPYIMHAPFAACVLTFVRHAKPVLLPNAQQNNRCALAIDTQDGLIDWQKLQTLLDNSHNVH